MIMMMWFSFSLNQRRRRAKEKGAYFILDAEAAVKLCDVFVGMYDGR